MRILCFTDNYRPENNAAAGRMHARNRHLVEAGHHVEVVTCVPNFPFGRAYEGYKNRWYQKEDVDGVIVHRVWTYMAPNRGVVRRSLDYSSFVPTAWLVLRRLSRPDLVFANTPHLLAPLPAVAARRRWNVPMMLEVADIWPASAAAVGAISRKGLLLRILERLERWLYRKSNRVIGVTEAIARHVETVAGSDGVSGNVDVIPNGVDLECFSNSSERGNSRRDNVIPILGYVGTMGMAHDVATVVDILGRSVSDRCRLNLVGPGACRDAAIDAARNAWGDAVDVYPPQAQEAIPRFWEALDIALVCLRNEPGLASALPSKIFEAMAAGKPVLLVAPEGEASRFVEENEVGLWAPAGDEHTLVAAAERLLDSESLRAKFGESGRRLAPAYSRKRQAERFLEIASDLLSG